MNDPASTVNRRVHSAWGLFLLPFGALGLLSLVSPQLHAQVVNAPAVSAPGIHAPGVNATGTSGNVIERAADFNLSRYGDRNYYVDPVFHVGEVTDVVLPVTDLSLSLPTARPWLSSWTDVDIPFIEGSRSEDALVHLGPLKLDADRVVTSVLMTDNAGHTRHDRDAKAVSILAVDGIRAMWRLSDTTQVSLQGDLIVLPFEGYAGLQGFGMPRDTLAFAMGASGSFDPFASLSSGIHGELSTGFNMGGWDVGLRNSFGARDFSVHRSFGSYLTEELTMLELDINPGVAGWRFDELGSSDYGRYAGGSDIVGSGELGEAGSKVTTVSAWDRTSSTRGYDNNYDYNEDLDGNLECTNNLSLTFTRAAEASIRPVVRVFRGDSGYRYANEEDRAREDRANWYEGATVGLLVDRPDLRFPPYVSYTVARDSNDPLWDQTLRLGVTGPGRITDYIHMDGNVGRHIRSSSGQEDQQDTVYEFGLTHQPRSTTTQSLSLARYVAEPEDRLRQHLTYRLHQSLGDGFAASFAASRTELEQYGDGGVDEEEWGVGGSLSYTRRTFAMAWRSYYEQQWNENTGKEDPDWRHQIELRWRLASRLQVRYQYTWDANGNSDDQAVDAEVDLYRHREMWRIAYRFRMHYTDGDDCYYENLLVLSASRDLEGMSLSQLFGAQR